MYAHEGPLHLPTTMHLPCFISFRGKKSCQILFEQATHGATCIAESISETTIRRCMKYGENEIQTIGCTAYGCKETHKPEKLYHEEQKDHRDGNKK